MGPKSTDILLIGIIILLTFQFVFMDADIAIGVEKGILEAAKQLDCKGVSLETANLRPRESW